MEKKSEIFRFRLDSELQRRAQRQAKIETRTMASLLRHALTCYLDQKAGKQ
jgi:predicted transcriptional regulator